MRTLALLLVSCSLVLAAKAADESKPAAGSPAASPSAAKPAKKPLEKGMKAAEIIDLVGKPETIKPLKVSKVVDGTAEIWIYRQKIGTKEMEVPAGEHEIPVFAGASQGDSNNMRMVMEPTYTMQHVIVYRVTSLLMVNGELVTARQTTDQSEIFD